MTVQNPGSYGMANFAGNQTSGYKDTRSRRSWPGSQVAKARDGQTPLWTRLVRIRTADDLKEYIYALQHFSGGE